MDDVRREKVRDSFRKAVKENGEALRRLAISERVDRVQELLYDVYEDEDDVYYDDGNLPCGCCSCCGCDCDYLAYDDDDPDFEIEEEDDDEEGE